MKTIYKKLLLLLLILPFAALAQGTMRGTVTDKTNGQPLPGVNVVVRGTSNGVSTDFDGKYSINNVKTGDVVVFSYIGYKEFTVTYQGQTTANVVMEEDANQLNEVVVQVGYGTVRRREATTSVTSLTSEEFAKGPLVGADQLLQGRVAGLQIVNGGGEPGGGSLVRIRSGSSLFTTNDPLYVIDNVPADVGGGSVIGGRNPLANINQNDIESITVLKDAAATAIYGSRASNGVIIITTKKGKSGDLKVNYNSFFQVSTVGETVDVFSGDQYRDFVTTYGTAAQQALLGTSNTDWQKEIYRTAFGTDHNISLSGGRDNIAYRASVGYSNLNGTLKRDNFERTTLGGNVNMNFFDKHLKLDVNNKTSLTRNNYSNRDAIGAAVAFDPTQPVHAENDFGNYFQWINEVNASRNPVALLEQKDNYGNSSRSIGNAQAEYKIHGFEDLKLIANFGYDYASGVTYGSTDPLYIVTAQAGGQYRNTETKKNQVMDLYANYNNTIESIKTNIDVTGGYTYQDFRYENNGYSFDAVNQILNPGTPKKERLNLQSFFARATVSIADKYILNGSFRADGSSRFTKDNRWGYFPAVSAAWRVHEESFMKDSKFFSDFKIRGSWGITGQQDTGIRYPSIPLYSGSTNTASYQIGYDADGNPIFIPTYAPLSYNSNLKWEETETINFGFDLGFFNNRLTASVDMYRRNTTDLILYAQNPQGVNFANYAFYNIGSLENKGVEISADVFPVKSDDMTWRIGVNATFQNSEITSLSNSDVGNFPGYNVTGIAGGTGSTIQNHQVGFAPFSFLVFEQAYDADGHPVEGSYVDRNGDGIINSEDLYRFHKPAADMFYGFNTDFTYKAWWLSMQWRGSAGNYNYNNVYSNQGNRATALPSNGNYLNNASVSVLDSGFAGSQLQSDYYIQDASFLKWDNVTIGYTFKDVFDKGSTLQLTGAVQNVLVITGYKGIDPEFNNGVDNNLYPRPRIFTLGLNVNF